MKRKPTRRPVRRNPPMRAILSGRGLRAVGAAELRRVIPEDIDTWTWVRFSQWFASVQPDPIVRRFVKDWSGRFGRPAPWGEFSSIPALAIEDVPAGLPVRLFSEDGREPVEVLDPEEWI